MELYHIEPQEFEVVDRRKIDDHSIRYDLRAVETVTECPACRGADIKHNGMRERKVRDLSEHGMMVGLVIHVQRYFCKTCGASWTDTFQSAPENAKMTLRMRDYIQEQAASKPFQNIADELGLSVQTIKRIFEDYISEKDQSRTIVAPTVLGMDENYLNGQYRGMYVDVENGLLIDMTEDRKLSTVKRWLFDLPEKERIKCVTMDMWGPYKEAVAYALPQIPIIIDKFHVIKNLNDSFDRIRKSFRESLSSKERIHFKNNRWLLLRNKEDLDYSSQLILHDLLESFPLIKRPYLLKESFREIYKASCHNEAVQLYEEWKTKAISYPEYKSFICTVDNWKTEIFNYFDYPYTNATTESLNALAKEIAARGRGYSYNVLRYKVLYGTKAAKPPKYRYDNSFVLAEQVCDNGIDSKTVIWDKDKAFSYTIDRYKAYFKLIAGAGTDINELLEELKKTHNDE